MDLCVDESCLRASMAEHVADALEGLTAAQQVNGQRVTQGVGTATGRLDARLFQTAGQFSVAIRRIRLRSSGSIVGRP